jgi:16S rRNA processing protein RimM
MAAQLRNTANASTARIASSGAADARVCVGAIAAAHGIKGEVKIKCFTANPLSVGAYGPVSDETGARSFRLTQVRAPGGAAGESVVLARLEGVTDRNAAEALRGLRLYVSRDALPEPETDEFYHHDLIGLTAMLVSGEKLGQIEAVHNFGAGDLLEVSRDDASSVMVPFTSAVVPTVDLKAGKVVIDPPEGLFDEGPVEGEEPEKEGDR